MVKHLKNYSLHPLFSLFPFLEAKQKGVYLDSAATTQKPWAVLDAIRHYSIHNHANVRRGAYKRAYQAEERVEAVREEIKNFIHADSCEEIIFTSGATEGVNLIAQTYGGQYLREGDEVLISCAEHHSNLLPWQDICRRQKAVLRKIELDPDGKISIDSLKAMLSARTKVVAVTYISNVLGVVNPIQEICHLSHSHGAMVVVDGAQVPAHRPINVQQLGCDFLVFSGHKMYGPTGIGVLYGKKKILANLEPYQLGGGMVTEIQGKQISYAPLPHRFEAGTVHAEGIIGLGAAVTLLQQIGYEVIKRHDQKLTAYLSQKLKALPAFFPLKMLGSDTGIQPDIPLLTFNMKGHHPLDIGVRLDADNIEVRTGTFCAQPLMQYLKTTNAIRVSCGLYNTPEEIDLLCRALKKAQFRLGSS